MREWIACYVRSIDRRTQIGSTQYMIESVNPTSEGSVSEGLISSLVFLTLEATLLIDCKYFNIQCDIHCIRDIVITITYY
jgi:hypothetical protein